MREIKKKFKEVFSELLLPQGFIFWKGVFVKLVNNEVIHVISLYKRDITSFTIEFNICTVYRYSLEKSNLIGNQKLYEFIENNTSEHLHYHIDEASLDECMRQACDDTRKYVLPVISKVDTIDRVIEYCVENEFERIRFKPIEYSVFYLMIKQNYEYDFEKYYKKELEKFSKWIDEGKFGLNYTYEDASKSLREPIDEIVNERNRILSDENEIRKVNEILAERYNRNREQLIKMGLIKE